MGIRSTSSRRSWMIYKGSVGRVAGAGGRGSGRVERGGS